MTVKIAVIYYAATGNVHTIAQAVAEGAEKGGAEVRLRRVPELAPDAAIDANPAWRAHLEATADIQLASHDDLIWANTYAFGTPTRYGNVSSRLKQFIDSTGRQWVDGHLAGKPATAFTSAINIHGGDVFHRPAQGTHAQRLPRLEAAHQRRMTHARTSIRQYLALPNGKVRPGSGRPGARCNR
jgi:multimeric flavodoxin WrbA